MKVQIGGRLCVKEGVHFEATSRREVGDHALDYSTFERSIEFHGTLWQLGTIVSWAVI
jgi:hypothetical protein